MGGRIMAWGKSVKTHDKLVKSLRPLAKKTEESFQKISSNLGKIRELTEEAAKVATNVSSIEYPTGTTQGAAASVAISMIAQSLGGPRHEMTPAEVRFHRSNLQAILRLQQNNVAEAGKLASILRQRRDCVKKILTFYKA